MTSAILALFIEEEMFTCKHVIQDNSGVKEYYFKAVKDLESKK